ncbi:MAG: hypothetical protein HC804_07870 [Anaerolineae bacterium]|nr:hypothetical protein [Anaerolineae bacterium]
MAGEQTVGMSEVVESGAGGGGSEWETIVSRLSSDDSEVRYIALSGLVSARSVAEVSPAEREPVREKLSLLVLEGDASVLEKFRNRQGGVTELDLVRMDAAKTLVRLWPTDEPATLYVGLLAGLAEQQDRMKRGNAVTAVKELSSAAVQRPEDGELQALLTVLKADEGAKEKLLQVVKEAEKENVRLAAVLALIYLGWGDNVDGALLIGLHSQVDREKVVKVAYEIQKSGPSLKQISTIKWDELVGGVVKELAGCAPKAKADEFKLKGSIENGVNFLLKLNELIWPLDSDQTPIDAYWGKESQKNQTAKTAVENLWYYLQEWAVDKAVPSTFKSIVLLSVPKKDAFVELGKRLDQGLFSAEQRANFGWDLLNDSQLVTAVLEVFPAGRQDEKENDQETEFDEKERAEEIAARKAIVQLVDTVLTNKKELVSLRLRRQHRASLWLAARQVDIYDNTPDLFETIRQHLKEIENEETERPESKAPLRWRVSHLI